MFPHHPQTFHYIFKTVIVRIVVLGINVGPSRVKAHSNAVQSCQHQLFYGFWSAAIGVDIDAALFGMLTYLSDCLLYCFPHQQRLALAALSETNDRVWCGFQVWHGELYDLRSSRLKL